MEQLQNAWDGSLKTSTLEDDKSVVQERGAFERQDSVDTDVLVALNEWGIPPRVRSHFWMRVSQSREGREVP